MTEWYADTASTIHKYMKIQTGGFLTMGKGETQTISMKHNIDTKFSTEA